MANDKMYLKCDGCDEELVIDDHLGFDWSLKGNLNHKLEEWLREHATCGGGTQAELIEQRDEARRLAEELRDAMVHGVADKAVTFPSRLPWEGDK